MTDYDKNKKLSHLKYWGVNNLYGWAVSNKLPVNGFNLSLVKTSWKTTLKIVMKDILLKLIFNTVKEQKLRILRNL